MRQARSNRMRDAGRRALLGTVAVVVMLLLAAPAQAADFGVAAFDTQITENPGGDPSTRAGAHPYAVTTTISFNTTVHPTHGPDWPAEPVKDIVVDLPPGLIGNPGAVATCTWDDFETLAENDSLGESSECPAESQVGTLRVTAHVLSGVSLPLPFTGPVPVFNLTPLPGTPARRSTFDQSLALARANRMSRSISSSRA